MFPGAAPLVVELTIPALAIAMLALFVLAHRRAGASTGKAALGATVWLALVGALAASGVLARFGTRPPPVLLAFVAAIVGGLVWSLSRDGKSIARAVPLWALVAAQGFRLPLELAMHRAAVARVMPVELSFGGYNFDIVTGATAILLAALVAAGRAPRALVLAWNLMGLGFLAAILVIAVGTMPGNPLAGAVPNTWVCYLPFVWLPTVLVPAAVAGHVLVWRSLATSPRGPGAA
ncbi:MAG: hypothetical protein ACXVCV_01035 [Polyangia bacterium]